MNNIYIQGKVLWFDQRDGNGIIIDAEGNEYYTDSSIAPSNLTAGERVSFMFLQEGKTSCAIMVSRNGVV